MKAYPTTSIVDKTGLSSPLPTKENPSKTEGIHPTPSKRNKGTHPKAIALKEMLHKGIEKGVAQRNPSKNRPRSFFSRRAHSPFFQGQGSDSHFMLGLCPLKGVHLLKGSCFLCFIFPCWFLKGNHLSLQEICLFPVTLSKWFPLLVLKGNTLSLLDICFIFPLGF